MIRSNRPSTPAKRSLSTTSTRRTPLSAALIRLKRKARTLISVSVDRGEACAQQACGMQAAGSAARADIDDPQSRPQAQGLQRMAHRAGEAIGIGAEEDGIGLLGREGRVDENLIAERGETHAAAQSIDSYASAPAAARHESRSPDRPSAVNGRLQPKISRNVGGRFGGRARTNSWLAGVMVVKR